MNIELDNTTNTPHTANSGNTVLTVTALNQSVARLLERSIPLTWIGGEISNFTRAASGHWYFTLKDANAQIRAVMFKHRAQFAEVIPKDGEQVEVRALVTLYTPRGDYQLTVETIRRAGLGNLYEAFLQLKQKLSLEGLFANERKIPLPYFARCIGVVTSPQAAALRDILITLQRRAPHVHIIIYPTPVQGVGAALKISQAIALASTRNECDVLIVTRGGGSIEDLWSFNDERVARTIAACQIPIIAGIGHETDFTIADFVADVRAPTPTAAAEMAVLPRADLLQHLDTVYKKMRRAIRYQLDSHAQTLDHLSLRSNAITPLTYIQRERSKLASLLQRMQHVHTMAHQRTTFNFMQLAQKLEKNKPDTSIAQNHLIQLTRQLQSATQHQLSHHQHQLHHFTGQLELLNPQRTLERGYAILQDTQGNIIKTPKQIRAPMDIVARLAQGEVDLSITSAQQRLS